MAKSFAKELPNIDPIVCIIGIISLYQGMIKLRKSNTNIGLNMNPMKSPIGLNIIMIPKFINLNICFNIGDEPVNALTAPSIAPIAIPIPPNTIIPFPPIFISPASPPPPFPPASPPPPPPITFANAAIEPLLNFTSIISSSVACADIIYSLIYSLMTLRSYLLIRLSYVLSIA